MTIGNPLFFFFFWQLQPVLNLLVYRVFIMLVMGAAFQAWSSDSYQHVAIGSRDVSYQLSSYAYSESVPISGQFVRDWTSGGKTIRFHLPALLLRI